MEDEFLTRLISADDDFEDDGAWGADDDTAADDDAADDDTDDDKVADDEVEEEAE